MSIFANETEGQGVQLYPAPETVGDSGYAAFGKPVPFYRRQAAATHLREMGVDSIRAFQTAEAMADAVARDDPHAAMQRASEVVDVIGVYRALAVICCAEKPASEGV